MGDRQPPPRGRGAIRLGGTILRHPPLQRAISDAKQGREVVVSAFAGFVRRDRAPSKRHVVWFRHGVSKYTASNANSSAFRD